MKILVLILASDNSPLYIDFQNAWKKYMNSHPNFDCFFYKSDTTIDCPILKRGNDILINIEESYYTIYTKTMKTFEFMYNELDKYDFVMRPNCSSFIRFDKYLELCATFPKEKFCGGHIGIHNGKIRFPAGACYTLSPDLVKRLIDEPIVNLWSDDVAIGYAMQTWNIPIHRLPRWDAKYYRTHQKITNLNTNDYHFRIRTINRENDVDTYNQLVKKYYNV